MKKYIHQVMAGIVAVFIIAGIVTVKTTAYGAADTVSITSKEELAGIAANPSGNYRLDKDIDMTGVEWIPFKFSGNLDGNGHAILNLTYSTTGEERVTSYDGNYKKYDTCFGGLFSIVTEEASVTNLKLINVRATLTADDPTFIGTVAGCLDGGVIDGCTITGRLDITTSAKMFGVGGIVGYGRGIITNTDSETTLVCIDTDIQNKDEQFMGGAYATGYIDMENCNVTVYGYDSDHGYVHNGGLTGMYMFYPYGQKYSGKILNCNVDGFITFFEDNTDRRAYCRAYWGELLSTNCVIDGCTDNFQSDERFDYSVNLLPDMCENPSYTKNVTESTDTEYGYTTYTCKACGYHYNDNYTLLAGDLKEIEAKRLEEEKLRLPQEAADGQDGAIVLTNNAGNVADGDWSNRGESSMQMLLLILIISLAIISIFIIVYAYNRSKKRKKKYK